jgi:hypothetical protein
MPKSTSSTDERRDLSPETAQGRKKGKPLSPCDKQCGWVEVPELGEGCSGVEGLRFMATGKGCKPYLKGET